MDFFFKGLVIGASIAAPVGPIGLLCIQRTMLQGRFHGFVSGLGAATADAVYGSIAGFGIDFISTFLIDQTKWVRLTGGVVLLLMGIKGLRSKPAEHAVRTADSTSGIGWSYLSTLLLTIANPMTILSFVAVFAALGVENPSHDYAGAILATLGVFFGSALWWLMLSSFAGWLTDKLNRTALLWIGRSSAVVIMGFGIWGVVSSGVIA